MDNTLILSIASVALPVLVLLSVANFLENRRRSVETNLKVLSYRNEIKDALNGYRNRSNTISRPPGLASRALAFKQKLSQITRWLNGYFGPKFGFVAFSRLYLFACCYSVIISLVAWTLGGNPSIAGVELGPLDTEIGIPRITRGLSGLLLLFLEVSALIFIYKLASSRNRTIQAVFALYMLAAIIGGLLNAALFSALLDGEPIEVAVSSTLAAAAIFGIIVPRGNKFFGQEACVLLAISIFIFCIIVMIFIHALSNTPMAVAFGVFSVGLPLVNSLIDHISWSMTRFFVQLCSYSRVKTIFFNVGLDIVIAVTCMILLSSCFLFLFISVNALPVSEKIDWILYGELAIESPLGPGIFITGMLITTLLPTVFHLSFALGAAFSANSPTVKNQAIAQELTIYERLDREEKESLRVRAAEQYMLLYKWLGLGVTSTLILFGLLGWIAWFSAGEIGPSLLRASTRIVHTVLAGNSWVSDHDINQLKSILDGT